MANMRASAYNYLVSMIRKWRRDPEKYSRNLYGEQIFLEWFVKDWQFMLDTDRATVKEIMGDKV